MRNLSKDLVYDENGVAWYHVPVGTWVSTCPHASSHPYFHWDGFSWFPTRNGDNWCAICDDCFHEHEDEPWDALTKVLKLKKTVPIQILEDIDGDDDDEPSTVWNGFGATYVGKEEEAKVEPKPHHDPQPPAYEMFDEYVTKAEIQYALQRRKITEESFWDSLDKVLTPEIAALAKTEDVRQRLYGMWRLNNLVKAAMRVYLPKTTREKAAQTRLLNKMYPQARKR
jgi:hypothetical protein